MDAQSGIQIRLVIESDLTAINDIYNYNVQHSTCTYQEEPDPFESRCQWFEKHRGERHPATVALLNERVVGWGSLTPLHSRSAYRFAVENSVYVDRNHHRRGIGSIILRDLIDRARAAGHHAIIASIDGEQAASIALHAKFGFQPVGRFRQVGFKFNRWLDVVYMQLML